jgi:hypothetical protein
MKKRNKKETRSSKESQRIKVKSRKSRNREKSKKEKSQCNRRSPRRKSSSNRRAKKHQRNQLQKLMTCTNYPNVILELARLYGLRRIQIVRICITRRLILETVRFARSPVAYRNS